MTKKATTIRIDDGALNKIKRFAAAWDMSIGDAIAGLIDFVDSFVCVKESDFQRRFMDLLDAAMLNVGNEAWWEGEVEVELEQMARAQQRGAAYERIMADRKKFAEALGILPNALKKKSHK